MWEIEYTDDFEAWWEGRTQEEQNALAHDIELLRLLGPGLSRPYVDTLHGSNYPNMKELRTKFKSHAFRMLFAFDPKRTAILLLGGDKAGAGAKRFYKQMIARADDLYAKHLEQLDK